MCHNLLAKTFEVTELEKCGKSLLLFFFVKHWITVNLDKWYNILIHPHFAVLIRHTQTDYLFVHKQITCLCIHAKWCLGVPQSNLGRTGMGQVFAFACVWRWNIVQLRMLHRNTQASNFKYMLLYWKTNKLWTAHTMLRTLYKVHKRNERFDCHRNMLHIKIHGINRKLFLDMKVYRAE